MQALDHDLGEQSFPVMREEADYILLSFTVLILVAGEEGSLAPP